MSRTKTISVVCLLVLMAFGFASFARSQTSSNLPAQTAQGENAQTMQALMNEVRQLRLAIQRSNLNTFRAQVTIERMRLQQQHVERLTDKLHETRDRMANVKMGQTEIQDELKRIDGRLSQERDPDKHREQEERQVLHKTRLGYLAQEEARMREQESQLVSQLQIEQAKLAELNDQLDVVQRELEIPPAENKPSQGGKRP